MLFVVINTVKNIFPVSQKFSLCCSKIPCVFPVWKKVRTKFPVFPVPWPPCITYCKILTTGNKIMLQTKGDILVLSLCSFYFWRNFPPKIAVITALPKNPEDFLPVWNYTNCFKIDEVRYPITSIVSQSMAFAT